jgi:FAD/FMN-containing dehydrogenase
MERQVVDVAALNGDFKGAVVAPGEEDWDLARQAFNLHIDQLPDVVALPADAEDVARVVRFAGERGLRIAAQRTGHAATPLGDLTGTILLKTSAMTGAEIDADERRARVNAGAQWQDVVPNAAERGLVALHGSAPDIGIVGYSLGGGIGWYVRKLGLQANSVTAIELVTADGELRRVDADNEPELFWALRGGGGNFGAVTAIEFSLHEVGDLYAGVLFFPFERAAEVLHAWREWIPTVPDEVTSVGRLMQFPPLEEIPEPVRGRSFSLIEVAFMGSEKHGAELVQPLRDLGPVMDTVATVPPTALSEMHMDPPEPVPYVGDDGMLDGLPEKAIDDLVAAAGPGSGSPLLSVELRHLGGAAARREPHHGALAAVEGSILGFWVGMAMDQAGADAVAGHCAAIHEAMAPYAAEHRYLNFAEEDAEPSAFFDAQTLARLREVKAEYDPGDMFRANHPLGV